MDQKQFNWENQLAMDECAKCTRNADNEYINTYNLFNFYTDSRGQCDQTSKDLSEFAAANNNLRYREGYGVANECTIDANNKMVYPNLTHGHEKRQFYPRVFQAVPDLGRGCANPDVESKLLISGAEDTSCTREGTEERSYDRSVPLLDCVEKWISGYNTDFPAYKGINTREAFRKCAKQA